MIGLCGAQDWAYDDDKLIIYGTCQLPADHPERYHVEWRGGQVWAEWSGPVETAPTPMPIDEFLEAWKQSFGAGMVPFDAAYFKSREANPEFPPVEHYRVAAHALLDEFVKRYKAQA